MFSTLTWFQPFNLWQTAEQKMLEQWQVLRIVDICLEAGHYIITF
jgi:hypothetical protein